MWRNRRSLSTSLRWALPALGALVVVSIALLAGCGGRSSEAVVSRRDITSYVSAGGKVVAPAAARADIMAPYEAPVDQIYVTVGKEVRRGEALLLFSAPQNQAYYQQARASLIQAQNSLAQAKKRFVSDLRSAQKQLASARAAEKQAQTAAAAPPTDQTGATSTPAGTGAGATAKRQAAEQAVTDAQGRMSEGLVPYQQAVASAEQQFEAAQAGSKAAQLKSPIAGTVLAVNATIGQTPNVRSKKPLVTVVNLAALHVAAAVNESQVRRLKTGDPATVTIDAFPNVQFPGTFSQVYTGKSGLAQGLNYVAIVDFTNIRGQAKPDMNARARIETATARDVLAVPSNAVFTTDHQRAVKVREGKDWRRRIVETGISGGGYTEIRSGLQEGDIVQTNP